MQDNANAEEGEVVVHILNDKIDVDTNIKETFSDG